MMLVNMMTNPWCSCTVPCSCTATVLRLDWNTNTGKEEKTPQDGDNKNKEIKNKKDLHNMLKIMHSTMQRALHGAGTKF